MRVLKRLRPMTACIYFAAVIGCAVFYGSPVIRAVSLITAAASAWLAGERRRNAAFYIGAFSAVTLLNPVIVPLGATVLFYIGKRPYTLEALFYGANNAMALTAVFLWFGLFGEVMTAERINSLIRRPLFYAPAAAFTLTLRYVPMFRQRYAEIRAAHKAAGYSCGDTYITRLRAALDAFFSLAASSLELSAETADSMKARGFALRPHSDIDRRPPRISDYIVAVAAAAVIAALAAASYKGELFAAFYPTFSQGCPLYCAVAYGTLCTLPILSESREVLRWRLSK